MIKKIAFLVVLSITFSCSEEIKLFPKPSNLIPRDTMVMVLKDLSILESHVKSQFPQANQNYKTLRKSGQIVLKKYNLDTTRLNSSISYYGSRQKEMQSINSQVLDSINRQMTELQSK